MEILQLNSCKLIGLQFDIIAECYNRCQYPKISPQSGLSQPYPVPIPLPQPKSRPLPDSRGIPDTLNLFYFGKHIEVFDRIGIRKKTIFQELG